MTVLFDLSAVPLSCGWCVIVLVCVVPCYDCNISIFCVCTPSHYPCGIACMGVLCVFRFVLMWWWQVFVLVPLGLWVYLWRILCIGRWCWVFWRWPPVNIFDIGSIVSDSIISPGVVVVLVLCLYGSISVFPGAYGHMLLFPSWLC